ncbi:MAG TPA: rhodanese-like domain-containing protein [Gammaproteobacteria bacterium]|nr:rhodanese-like domain-containing protein [Gammaproteobacteria bacterium]
MNEFLQFLLSNWLLLLLLVMVVLLIFLEELQSKELSRGGMAPEELSHALNKGYEIIDLRDPKDFASGHIPNARQMDSERFAKLDFNQPKYNKWVVCCKSGIDSSGLIKSARENNKTSVSYLIGGIDAWKEAGFVLKKGNS